MEIYKPVPGYPGYEVSNFGNVRSLDRYTTSGAFIKGRVLKPMPDKKGYLHVRPSFGNKGKAQKVHRLVAQLFIPNPKGLPSVNHKDGNKQNNKVENLEWCTHSENRLHATRVLKVRCGMTGKLGKDFPGSKEILQIKDGLVVGRFWGTREASRVTGVRRDAILRVIKGHKYYRTAGGFVWKHAEEA